MSEHRTNPRAIAAASLPALLPVGVVSGVHFDVRVDAQPNVLLLPADRIRMNGDVLEIATTRLEGEPGAWQVPPEGAYVHELGKPLPPEHCDVVVLLGTVAQDTLDRPILTPGGAPSQPKVSMMFHVQIARMPLVDWQRGHMAQLRGVQS